MKINSFKVTAGAMALAFAAWLAPVMQAQPMYDQIQVNLPYTVTMQDKTLQPGDYTIRQLPSTGGSGRVLLFYTNDGMKFETSAMTIPALDIDTARETKLVLNHVGEDYYISKIWVQGKDYGYELPIPSSLKSRQNERMSQSTVPATYQPSSSTTTAAEPAPPANSNNTADTANRPLPDTSTSAATTTTPQSTQPEPQPAAQPEPQPTPQPATSADNSADRAMPDQDAANPNNSANRESLPSTAAGWLTMLWAGGALSGAGLMLRRKR